MIDYVQCARCGVKRLPEELWIPPRVCRDLYQCEVLRKILRAPLPQITDPDPDEAGLPRVPIRLGGHCDENRLPGELRVGDKILRRLLAGEALTCDDLQRDYGLERNAAQQRLSRLHARGLTTREYQGKLGSFYSWKGGGS